MRSYIHWAHWLNHFAVTGSSDYGQDSDKTKVETDDAASEDGGSLVIEEGRGGLVIEEKQDMRDYGETLDLSKRKEEESCYSDGGGTGQQATTLPLIATHINTSRVLEGQ